MATNQHSVEAHARLMQQVATEQEDVLSALLFCNEDPVAERLWARLVDLLVEGMFLDLRRSYLTGELDRLGYLKELGVLADRCRAAGLWPLPAKGISLS